MGAGDSKTIWDDKSASWAVLNMHRGNMFYHQSKDEYWEVLQQLIIPQNTPCDLFFISFRDFRVIEGGCEHSTAANTKTCDGISVSDIFSIRPWPFVLVCSLCSSVACYNELSVVRLGGGHIAYRKKKEKKKAYLCSAVDLRLSVGKSLGTPFTLHPSILPPVHSSLHRWLPGSYAYLLIILQGFSLTGIPYGGSRMTAQSSQIAHRWLISVAVFKQAPRLDLSVFFTELQGLSVLPLSELKRGWILCYLLAICLEHWLCW